MRLLCPTWDDFVPHETARVPHETALYHMRLFCPTWDRSVPHEIFCHQLLIPTWDCSFSMWDCSFLYETILSHVRPLSYLRLLSHMRLLPIYFVMHIAQRSSISLLILDFLLSWDLFVLSETDFRDGAGTGTISGQHFWGTLKEIQAEKV